jgi:membrane-associated protease RseP (regulator of RpoE activity)
MPLIRAARAWALVLLALAAAASADPPTATPGPDLGSGQGAASEQSPPGGEQRPPGRHATFHAHGYPSRGRLGIQVQPMTPELREFFSAPADRGVLVVHVEAGRAGQLAGIAVGDVLIAVAGVAVERPIDLIAAVARAPAGEKLPIELLQKGEKRSVDVLPEGGAIPDFADLPGRPAEPVAPEEAIAPGDPVAHGERGPMPDLMRRLDDLEQRLERLERAPDAK